VTMRRTRLVLPAVAVATAVLGCSSTSPAPTSASEPARQSAQTTQLPGASLFAELDGHAQSGRYRYGGRERVEGSPSSQISAPPADAPLPPGLVTSIAGGPDHWSVQLVVDGSAQQAQAAAAAFYVAHAFRRDSAYAVHNEDYLISMIAESRDHSPTESNLTLVVKPSRG
jgi:hypothetical protein